MTAAVLNIGTELTRGELVNSNAAVLSAALTEAGFEVTEHVVVDDDRDHIVDTLRSMARRAQVIVCTGGLGPTTDDLTTEAVAHLLGKPLVRHEPSLEHIRRRFERLGRPMSPSNAKQADFPQGAEVLPNPVGTAPGFSVKLEGDGTLVFFMPGVPREMTRMFEEQVLPRIRSLAPHTLHQARLRTFGLPESVVGEKLAGVEGEFPGITIGYRAHFPEIEVKVLARAENNIAARDLCERAVQVVRRRLGNVIFGEAGDTFAGVVGRALRAKGHMLAIAESCTGGLVGSLLTAEAGASDFLLVDAVTYANSAKTRLLGVEEDVIRGHGAVSMEVACAMAEGVKRVSGADVALALTGIAGPGGGTEAKPVGTVFVAVAGPRGTAVEERHLGGDRKMIQTLASYIGLALVRRVCEEA